MRTRQLLMISTCAGLAVVAAAAAGARPSVTTATARTTGLVLHTQTRSRFASASGPLTTAQCERQFAIECYEPAQLQQAYDEKPLFAKRIDGRGQTIVIVDAFGSPTMAHDLGVFDRTFGLPDPPSFSVITPAGPVNRVNAGWAGETTLDVEWSHAMAPGANILLVETPTSEDEGTSGFPDIVKAETYVVDHHLGGVISQSFGATEQTFPSRQSLIDLRGAYVDAARNGVSVLAASGDSGAADVMVNGHYYRYPVTDWPPSDPLVTGVGGTELQLDAQGNRLAPDVVWNDTDSVPVANYFGDPAPDPLAGGGGLSVIFGRPSYQNAVKGVVGAHRGVPDIALSAACSAEVDQYQSFPGQPAGWYTSCGTSEASPLFAGIVALVDQEAKGGVGNLNPALYALGQQGHGAGIVDITAGTTTVTFDGGSHLHTVVGAQAVPGYDIASGVGTVDAARFVPAMAAYARAHPRS